MTKKLENCNPAINAKATTLPKQRVKTVKKEFLEYESHKRKNAKILPLYEYCSENKKESVMQCGKYLWLDKYSHKLTKEELRKFKTYRCKDRLCPFCQWKKAQENGRLLYRALELLKEKQKLRYIFVTFTMKNCELEQLGSEIRNFHKSFSTMTRSVRFKKSIQGFYRSTEFTINQENKSLNPHIHCIFAVRPVYFNTQRNYYIKQEEWRKMWQKVSKTNYLPFVNVKVIKPKNKHKNPESSSVSEVTKYTIKDTDFQETTSKEFKRIHDQIKGKRFQASGGVIKEAIAEAKKLPDDGEIDFETYELIEQILFEFNFDSFKYSKLTKNH